MLFYIAIYSLLDEYEFILVFFDADCDVLIVQ